MNNTFKTIFMLFMLTCSMGYIANGASPYDIPNNLAKLGVIESHYNDPYNYNLLANISRREMLKIMMNLSSRSVIDRCDGRFVDMSSDDWGCKYAESALRAGYIAPNSRFRPNDNITEAEALKMIMQSRDIPKMGGVSNWVEAYRLRAIELGLLDESRVIGDSEDATRSMVFTIAYDAIHATLDSDDEDVSPDFNLDDFLDDIFTNSDTIVDTDTSDVIDTESQDIDIIDTDDEDTPTTDIEDIDAIVDTTDTEDASEDISTDTGDTLNLDISRVESTILTPGDTIQRVMIFDLEGRYDDLLLTDLYLSNVASGDRVDMMDTVDELFIYVDGHRYAGYTLDSDTIYFNFGEGYTIKRDERSKFILAMTIRDSKSRTTGTIQIQVLQPDSPVDGTISGMRLISKSNGNNINWKSTNNRDIISNTHLISRTTPTISLNTNGISANDIYKFGLTADKNRDLILDSISFNIYTSENIDLNDPNLNISLKRAGGAIVSDGDDITIGGSNITIKFDNAEMVSAGATNNYVLSLSGANIASGSSREVQMIDFVYKNDLSGDIVDIVSVLGYFDKDNNPIIPSDTVSFRY